MKWAEKFAIQMLIKSLKYTGMFSYRLSSSAHRWLSMYTLKGPCTGNNFPKISFATFIKLNYISIPDGTKARYIQGTI